jgi:hypothetical protein
MPKYRVSLSTNAWVTVTVEADNAEAAIEEAYQDAPNLCAQCSGWGRNFSLELGDEWELMPDGVEETP